MTDIQSAGPLGQPGPLHGEATSLPPGDGPSTERNASLWADAWRELIRNPVFVLSSVAVLAVMSMALAPWLWTSLDPQDCEIELGRQGPGGGHFFGMTKDGCDMYASVIYGSRPSIAVAVLATLGVVLVGILTGILAGYYGRWVDAIISRVVDIVMGLPFLLGAITLLALWRKREWYAVVAVLIVLGWPLVTRIMRASVLATKNMDYVQAARSLGASDLRIITRHVLPNAIAPVIVVATIALGSYVAAEATLSFLGVGLRPPTVSWGVLITHGTQWALSPGHAYLLLVPAGLLVVTVLAFILMGDALRDALDPKLR
ncbi:MAG: ABC transporter permease subunit [Micromonosporaceae bacterium]|nr:ABC transporter permease subunit [Micromonosporaceae bacterium]